MSTRGLKIAVYSEQDGWLMDTCVGASWSWCVDEAMWFDSVEEAKESMLAAEIQIQEWFSYPRMR